jgi:hypothetical protein
MLTAPAYSPYVFVVNFFLYAYVVLAGLKRKIAAPLMRGTVIVKLNTKPCQAKNAFDATPSVAVPSNPRD